MADISLQSASMEDYLEAINLLDGGKGASVTGISRRLGVTKPSVTSALSKLGEAGLVNHERYGRARLTGEGRLIALDVHKRHQLLHHFLAEVLGVDVDVAAADACKLEHSLSPTSMQKLARYIKSLPAERKNNR
jgi:DtxR family Mn-dependent transcriptional regulator